jgi:hypothetical protein
MQVSLPLHLPWPICEASKLLFLPPFQVLLKCVFALAHLPALLHIVTHILHAWRLDCLCRLSANP